MREPASPLFGTRRKEYEGGDYTVQSTVRDIATLNEFKITFPPGVLDKIAPAIDGSGEQGEDPGPGDGISETVAQDEPSESTATERDQVEQET